ncbi:MAG TPA: TIGR01777 family oxidoreductase [Solirubrobacteraceae bacterium]|nr:TIGR01777 family oxidoreductase [Solirubrobacteraceae bacterium]
MRVTVTGATGLIGPRVVASLRARGDEVTVLSRDPERARRRLSDRTRAPASIDGRLGALQAVRWDLFSEPAPSAALAGRDAVVHLAGENVAQRWTTSAKRAIRESRVTGTRHLVRGIASLGDAERPRALVSASAIGYYGARDDEPIDEEAPAAADFLAQTCSAWEAEAEAAGQLGVRVVRVRTGVVLDRHGGALGKMLIPFKLGVGGPVAGGRQYISWIHTDDLVGIMLAATCGEQWHGPVNATAPEPQRNRDFSRALGRALHRPSLLPVPGAALRLLYGEMAEIVTTGARVLPARALVLGYEFRYPRLDSALRAALGAG